MQELCKSCKNECKIESENSTLVDCNQYKSKYKITITNSTCNALNCPFHGHDNQVNNTYKNL